MTDKKDKGNVENFRWSEKEEEQKLKKKLHQEAKDTNTSKSKIIKKSLKHFL